MIRLLLLLVTGIGLAMYFADRISGPDHPVRNAKMAEVSAPKPDPAPEAPVILASLNIEPAKEVTPSPRMRQTRIATANMVSFLHPVVIGADGKPIPAATTSKPVQPAKVETPDAPSIPVHYVTASRVNVRGGPSTANGVIGSVEFAEAVQVLSDPNGEWVHIRIEGDGIDGFMASRFLAETAPSGQ